MTTCTDCPVEVEAADMPEHMMQEHGVNYAMPPAVCDQCGESHPCKRVETSE